MIKYISYPRIKQPIFIAAWPGMGEVAYRSALYLKEVMDFKMFAKLEADKYFKPAGVIVEKGVLTLPHMPAGIFYYCSSRQHPPLILFLGEAQPPLEYGKELAGEVIHLAKKYQTQLVITFAAKPEAIDHRSQSRVWLAATTKEILTKWPQPVNIMNEGQISGLNGLLLGVAKEANIPGVCLLAEIPFYTVQIENPRANIALLQTIDQYIKLKLNLDPLKERAKFIEQEIDKLMHYLKGESQTPPPLSEDDIEKIKKDLSTYTKLPQSVRQKIENLFSAAERDISKARELKDELDHWNVYKDYEDRFLDLFKRNNSQGNPSN